jgi:hypothetical protein
MGLQDQKTHIKQIVLGGKQGTPLCVWIRLTRSARFSARVNIEQILAYPGQILTRKKYRYGCSWVKPFFSTDLEIRCIFMWS